MLKNIRDKADMSPILESHFSLQLYNALLLDQCLQKELTPYTLRYSDTYSIRMLSAL